jgi:hypothetical protein
MLPGPRDIHPGKEHIDPGQEAEPFRRHGAHAAFREARHGLGMTVRQGVQPSERGGQDQRHYAQPALCLAPHAE